MKRKRRKRTRKKVKRPKKRIIRSPVVSLQHCNRQREPRRN